MRRKAGLRVLIFLTAVFWSLALTQTAFAQSVRGDLSTRFAPRKVIEHEGRAYGLKRRMTSVLLMGTDRRTEDASAYRSGGQADFIMLLAVDDENKTITPIEINRDTMTEITVLSVLGSVNGTMTAQIALAHAFGDGGERSGELAAQAVGALLLDTPIDEYLTLGMDGIVALNDLIGGVEVTLEDDFSAYDPSMTPGKTIRLKGMQAEYYLRRRYDVGDQSNISRLARQRTYLNLAKAQLYEKIRASKSFVNALFEGLAPYMVTGMNRGKLINLANKAATYTFLPIMQIEGEARVGESGFMEFYADEDRLRELVISVFYE